MQTEIEQALDLGAAQVRRELDQLVLATLIQWGCPEGAIGGADGAGRIAELAQRLRQRVADFELQAAHHREFIPDGYPAPEPVRSALRVAMLIGYVEALRHVLDDLEW
jgi:hypothetical protein